MRARTFARLGTALAGAATWALALAGTAQAASGTIMVPDDFNPARSDTRATGHYEVRAAGSGSGPRVPPSSPEQGRGVRRHDHAALCSGRALARARQQLRHDRARLPAGRRLRRDGSDDGILVGETVYDGDWWLNNAAKPFVKAGAPNTGGGSGSLWYGTLDEWSTNFPNAVVRAFGFSLGSGVQGDWVIDAINFGGTVHLRRARA